MQVQESGNDVGRKKERKKKNGVARRRSIWYAFEWKDGARMKGEREREREGGREGEAETSPIIEWPANSFPLGV